MSTRRSIARNIAMTLAPVRCTSPTCKLVGKNQYLAVGAADCLVCKSPLTQLVPIHVIVPEKGGPILSTAEGKREVAYNFVCERAKKRLADNPGDPNKHPKAYTGDPACATCHDCLVASGYELNDLNLLIKKPTEDDQLV